MEKTKYTFFFILLLAIVFVSAHITIKPNVQFSFGCDPSLPLPQNCSGNYYFNNTLLNNESPQYSFFNIKLYSNYSMWDNKTICRPTPFYQYVYTYSDIFNWECCISNWVAYNTTCDVTDHNTKYYLDSNNCLISNGLPADNGTIQSCNYCSEDLFQYVGECTENSTQTIDYTDLNKFTCCDVTNISTDCSILTYPYNETTYQDCNSTKANIGTLNCEVNPHLSPFEKQDCVAEIPVQYMSLGESYKCVSYVKDKLSGEIVQVNPENQTLPVRESRLYFEPMGSVVNFYYTSKNLKAKAYDIGVECSSASRILYSEQPINAQYEDLSFVFTRSEWLGMNAGYLALGMVLLLIIILGFVVYFGWLKK
jgi:hypothetical protein